MVCPFHAQCQLAWVQCRQLLCDMGQRAPPFLVIGAGTTLGAISMSDSRLARILQFAFHGTPLAFGNSARICFVSCGL